MALPDPLPRPLARGWREEVIRLREASRSESFAPLVYAGRPGGTLEVDQWRLPATDGDRGLRLELCAGLLQRARSGPESSPAYVWLARPGEHRWHDLDADWTSVLRTVSAERGHPLDLVVLTRRGWWEPVTDRRRTWVRARR